MVESPDDELLSDEEPEDAVAAAVLLLTPDELRMLEVLTALVTALEDKPPGLLDEEIVWV